MKDEVRRLIQAVVENKYTDAKKLCRLIVENDSTQKEERFCRRMLDVLTTQSNLIELPFNIKGLLYAEDVETSFREERYFLAEREKQLFNKIETMTNTAMEMQNMGIRYLNSTLLYGESGTGKTMFGKYVAYKQKKPFYYMSFAHTIDSLLGGTGRNLHTIFDYVKGQECVFMIDEVDSIGVKRGSSKEVGEINRIVIGLMQELDMLGNDVVLLAATNRADILDEALMRRFSLKHEVKRFNASEMKCMINSLLIDIGLNANIEALDKYVNGKVESREAQGVVMNDVINRIAKAVEDKTVEVEF